MDPSEPVEQNGCAQGQYRDVEQNMSEKHHIGRPPHDRLRPIDVRTQQILLYQGQQQWILRIPLQIISREYRWLESLVGAIGHGGQLLYPRIVCSDIFARALAGRDVILQTLEHDLVLTSQKG